MEQPGFGSENDLAVYRLERAKTDLQSVGLLLMLPNIEMQIIGHIMPSIMR